MKTFKRQKLRLSWPKLDVFSPIFFSFNLNFRDFIISVGQKKNTWSLSDTLFFAVELQKSISPLKDLEKKSCNFSINFFRYCPLSRALFFPFFGKKEKKIVHAWCFSRGSCWIFWIWSWNDQPLLRHLLRCTNWYLGRVWILKREKCWQKTPKKSFPRWSKLCKFFDLFFAKLARRGIFVRWSNMLTYFSIFG